MQLKHIALSCSTEEKSDQFYKDLLGLRKMEPKTVSSSLSKKIFQIDSEFTIINYLDDEIRFEIFISKGDLTPNPLKVEHVCLEVHDLKNFLSQCRKLGVNIIQVPKGEKMVTFIRDFDGNLFEITEKLP